MSNNSTRIGTPFPFPGGKSRYSDLVVSNIPEHTAYIEPFGGAAGVLFNKPRSKVEVYNDLDGDIVHFFETLRDRPDDLIDWLRETPFHRATFEEFREDFYHSDERPDDDIERAGRFFYLRYTQYSGRYDRPVSMAFSTASGAGTNVAQKLSNKRERLDEFARRLDGVLVENQTYQEVVGRYDDETSVLYFDPPYFGGADDYYRYGDDFDHGEFADTLANVEGFWLCSYKKIPDPIKKIDIRCVATRETRYTMGSGGKGLGDESNTERVLMNYDPEEVEMWVQEPD